MCVCVCGLAGVGVVDVGCVCWAPCPWIGVRLLLLSSFFYSYCPSLNAFFSFCFVFLYIALRSGVY